MKIENVLNTVIHGDCLDIMKQLPDESVDLIVTSPPYNLRNTGGLKKKNTLWTNCTLANGYDGYADNMPYSEYLEWQKQCVSEMFRLIKQNGAIFYNNKNRVQNGLLEDRGVIVRDFPLRQIITWKRAGMFNFNNTYYAPTTEQIYLICKPDFRLVQGANKYSDVWEIVPATNNPHPAPFPVELTDRIIQSTDAQIILDPFGGSGTTAVSSIKSGRSYILIEQSAKYCEMANLRIQSKDWRNDEPPYACDLF